MRIYSGIKPTLPSNFKLSGVAFKNKAALAERWVPLMENCAFLRKIYKYQARTLGFHLSKYHFRENLLRLIFLFISTRWYFFL